MEAERTFPTIRRLLSREGWGRFEAALGDLDSQTPVEALVSRFDETVFPPFLPDLIRLEWARRQAADGPEVERESDRAALNPTLQVLQLQWKLCALVDGKGPGVIERGEEWALVWRHPRTGQVVSKAAEADELLSIKLAAEETPAEKAAREGGVSPAAIEAAKRRAIRRGFLIGPQSRIRRNTADYPEGERTPEEFTVVNMFTLQWHLTHACDLHCKHCYDRSRRESPTLDQAMRVVDDLQAFCAERRVAGHISLTGGNPLFYPHFFEVYRAAAGRGFALSVLGNAAEPDAVKRMVEIQRPLYYQVSLEGLPDHNDDVRGRGYFDRVMRFLEALREMDVPSAVMLTLTRDNLEQVIPLAEMLRGKAGRFTFNRLSPVGEGAGLLLPEAKEYEEFLEEYVSAAQGNPIIGFKDNLINIVLRRRGMELFDGCTGFGCGAAFNFLCLLPDGEVHACRKFPSVLGSIHRQSLAEIYDSPEAERYRGGSRACRGCQLRPMCGGCLAVASGCGGDFAEERDPFCFFAGKPEKALAGDA